MVNKVILIGNLGKNAKIVYGEGYGIIKFSIATTESYKKGDEWVEEITWHNITFFTKSVNYYEEVLKKGVRVFVEGANKTNTYEKNGENRTFYFVKAKQVKLLQGERTVSEDKPKKQDDQTDDLPF